MNKQLPPFCPNPACRLHHRQTIKHLTGKARRWAHRKGYRFLRSGKAVQKFRCTRCGSHFSSRSFSIDYWEKRHLDYHRLLYMLVSSMSLRSIARALHCSMNTVVNKIERMTRQALAVQAQLAEELTLSEDLAADGFESFAVSQYFPNNFNLLVGTRSQFVYAMSYSQLRRKGRMTALQKQRAAELRASVPISAQEIANGFSLLVEQAVRFQQRPDGKKSVTLITDEKPDYVPVLSDAVYGWNDRSCGFRIHHHQVSGKLRRDRSNPLFPVNYMDREIRKDLAEHVRESTRYARNVNSSVGRMELYLFYHNFLKPFRINGCESRFRTHAEAAGISVKRSGQLLYRWLTRRFFKSHLHLEVHQEKVWRRAYSTPGKLQMDSLPAYVFA